MKDQKQKIQFGIMFLLVGVALLIALDPWILAAPFLIIGISLLVAGLANKEPRQTVRSEQLDQNVRRPKPGFGPF